MRVHAGAGIAGQHSQQELAEFWLHLSVEGTNELAMIWVALAMIMGLCVEHDNWVPFSLFHSPELDSDEVGEEDMKSNIS